MPRVISLIASGTEIIYSLGQGKTIVGRSHECDYPMAVQSLPICTEPNFDVNGTSAEIDQRVKDQLKHSAPLYRVHGDVIKKLNPDVIVTQSHCKVCAVSDSDLKRELGVEGLKDVKVVSLQPNDLNDIWSGVKEVASALQVGSLGEERVREWKKRMDSISSKAQASSHQPTVAAIEWIDPLMAAGNWVPELIQMAGGKNLFGEAGKHSPWMTWEDLKKADPDIVLVLPCGYDISKTRTEMKPLIQKEGWMELKAVINNQVFLLDGNQYFNRPGPRLVESLEILAEIIHPDLFDFGHKHDGWEYYGFDFL